MELKTTLENKKEKLNFSKSDPSSEGCKCNIRIESKAWSDDDKNINYKEIKKIGPKTYFKINSNYFYVKRYNKTYSQLFKENNIIPKDFECPSNYKSCEKIEIL